jgi:hypothetical protein
MTASSLSFASATISPVGPAIQDTVTLRLVEVHLRKGADYSIESQEKAAMQYL